MKANIADLEIAIQLLPLFDFTGNSYAREILSGVLLQPPSTRQEIHDRQQLIKTFIDNSYTQAALQYSRQDFEEVYQSFNRLNDQTYYYDSFDIIAAAQLLWRRRYRHEMRGRLAQLVFFIERIQDCFESIDTTVFAADFGARVTAWKQWLQRFRAREIGARIRRDDFRIKDQLFLLDLLNRKIDQKEAAAHWRTFFEYEAWWSLAKGMEKQQFVFPVFSDNGIILKDFYHPALKQPVKNNLSTKGTVMLLTGPNMSGKSTLLKALAICVYLAHTGVGVPAAYCEVPYFDSITAVINLSDDLKNGYSHFMMEVQHLKNVLAEVSERRKCFAVFDELFRGTNVDDALDISQQTIQGLQRFEGSFFVISTHLYQLKKTLNDVMAWHLDCALTAGTPRFLYQLKDGWSDLKIGRIIFEKEGLPQLLQAPVTSLP